MSPNSAAGRIAVCGDEIEFFGANVCGGRGTYRWSIEADALSFTAITESCSGRGAVLDGQTYTR